MSDILLIDDNIMTDLANTVRSKNKSNLEYTPAQLATAISQLSPHDLSIPSQQFKQYLFDYQAADPQFTSLTGGWGINKGYGLNSSYSDNTIRANNMIGLSTKYYTTSASTINAIDFGSYINRGYSNIVFQIFDPIAQDYLNGTITGTNAQLLQMRRMRDLSIYFSTNVNQVSSTGNTNIANGFTTYLSRTQPSCMGLCPTGADRYYVTVPKIFTCNFKKFVQQNPALANSHVSLVVTCGNSSTSNTDGSANINIAKVYII